MKRNLIFAMTPLHMLICENIIKKRSNELFDIIVLGDGSEKSKFYFNRVKANVSKSKYIKINLKKSTFSKLIYLLYFFIFFLIRKYRYNTLIFGNLNLKLNHLAMLIFSFSEINTYDDGLANLLEDGDYSINDKSIIFNRNKILKSSSLHYTIFDEKNTAKCKLEKIYFLNNQQYKENNKKSVNVFLGQPLQELDESLNNAYVYSLLKKIKIDIYFPHPREYEKKYNLNYSDSVLIVEDYIIKLAKEGCGVNIYGFYSTALINIKSAFPLLNVYYLYDEKIFNNPKLLGVENIFNNFKIEKIQ